jgi:type IV pilus assembly protein PilY1
MNGRSRNTSMTARPNHRPWGNNAMNIKPTCPAVPSAIALAIALLVSSHAFGASTDIANVPMAVSNMVTPNVLVIYDNSQSMDAYMNGVMVSGNNASTRGNIGRSVMRNAISGYRNAFNWGLMSYGMSSNPPSLYSTYSYYMGSSTGMVFTSNCTGYTAGVFNGAPSVAGTSTAGGGRCIANPQPSAGREYITFDFSSDDSNIVDVLYYGGYASSGVPTYNQMWAPATNTSTPTSYKWYASHDLVSTWNNNDFSSQVFSGSLSPTDAGFIPSNSGSTAPDNVSRSLYLPRGWGYSSSVTGSGALNEAVKVDSTTHYNALQTLLASETNGSTGELKNGAVYTTLKGTLATAKSYFAGSLSGQTTPVAQTCQQNFVMLVTDGLPTGDTSGNLYSASDRTNSCTWNTTTNSCASGTFGTAATDAISAVNALRTTSVSGVSSVNKDGTGAVTGKFDIQTYVVALGDTVANPRAQSVMNAMAYNGGTATALPAGDATAFQNAISSISDDITAKVGAAAAVAVANAHVTSTDNASYASSYNSGTWTGDLNANAIDVTTGVPSTTSLWTSGSAGSQLDARTSANRYIVTSTDTAGACTTACGVQFQPTAATTTTKVSTAQQTALNSPSATDGPAVLAYLRGDRSGETAGTYRQRAHLLGDTINAEPVLVKAPTASYADTGYDTFKTNNASRTRVVFQGANDGMLHAFVAGTGAESWAYVPNMVIGNLNNLSRKTGFTHLYYVDGTPATGDVDFKNVDGATGSGTDWHSILVGGLAKGGRGYYALDVTTPTATSEADAKSKVLWEFPNSVSNSTARASAKLNMGYSFGKPVIVKTAGKGWVALVTSGYNNGTNTGDSGGDGLGHLFVVNPKTGDLIKDIPTTGCSATPTTAPCGLSQISAWVDNSDIDNTTDYVYGGDLKGNVWRFDLTANSPSSWSVSKLAILKDASGATQAVTTAPELADMNGSRMVLIGTGEYLGTSDIPGATGASSSSTQTQTIYGLKDSLSALAEPLRPALQQQTFTTSGTKRTSSNNTVDYSTKSGWYLDLPSTGERLNTDPVVALSALIFTTNIPSTTVCQPGGSSWEYFINFKTGGLVDNSNVTWSGESVASALASRPVLVQLPNGKVVSLVRTSDAQTTKEDVPVTAPGSAQKRITWRELFN